MVDIAVQLANMQIAVTDAWTLTHPGDDEQVRDAVRSLLDDVMLGRLDTDIDEMLANPTFLLGIHALRWDWSDASNLYVEYLNSRDKWMPALERVWGMALANDAVAGPHRCLFWLWMFIAH